MILNKDSCIRIPNTRRDEIWVDKIIKHLTRKSQSYADKSTQDISQYYDEYKGEILIPRFYPIEQYGYSSKNNLSDGEDICITTSIKPKDLKQENAIDWFCKSNHGILCMKPGEGKTVITIQAISKIGKKAIIFVHTTPLLEQWADRFSEHSDIPRNKIGRLTSTVYNKSDLNFPIVICTVQAYCSLLKKGDDFINYIKNANFGVAVWDECHTSTGAEQFSKSSLYTFCKRTFGLSATPQRLDNCSDIINYHLGEVFIPQGISETLEPRVVMLYSDFGIYEKYKTRIRQLYLKDGNPNKGMFNKATYLSLLHKSENFKKIIKRVMNQVDQKDRNTLVLSERINLLQICIEYLSDGSYGLFSGNTNGNRESILNKKIVLATFQKGRDGLDIQRLDSLIFLTPPSNLLQAVGRIVRTFPGKSQPVVIDGVDSGCPDMMNRASYRKRFYESKGWKIEEKHI